MDKGTHIEGGKEFIATPITSDSFKEQALLTMELNTRPSTENDFAWGEMIASLRAFVKAEEMK